MAVAVRTNQREGLGAVVEGAGCASTGIDRLFITDEKVVCSPYIYIYSLLFL